MGLSAQLRLAALLLTLPTAAGAQDFSHQETTPAPQTALIDRANEALARADYPAALKLLTALNTQTPNDPLVLYDLGLTLEALEPAALGPTPQPATSNPQPATSSLTPESCYRAAVAANPGFAAPHVALGLLLARTKRPAEARTELLTATRIPDADPALAARAFRALARLELNGSALSSTPPNPAAAAADLLAALKLTPEQPADILLAAETAEAAADLPSAEQAYRRYLAAVPATNPDALAATAALAHILLAERHPAEAEALLTPALAAHPGDPSFTAQLAETYLASGDPAKVSLAAPLLEKLHAANPADANVARLLARVYVETGHPDQADPLYATLIAQNETHPDPTLLDDRADLLIRLHRPAEAERLLKQAIAKPSAFPTPAAYADAVTHLAFAAAEIDDPRMTLQALALRATVLPPSPSTLFLGATANDSLHQNRQAVDLYKQFLAAAHGDFPDQESQARRRLTVLEPMK